MCFTNDAKCIRRRALQIRSHFVLEDAVSNQVTARLCFRILINLISFSAFGNVVPSDLYESLDAAQHDTATDSFAEILGSWADRRGYPLVTVKHERLENLLIIN